MKNIRRFTQPHQDVFSTHKWASHRKHFPLSPSLEGGGQGMGEARGGS